MSPTSRHISFQEGVRSVAFALGLGGMLLPTAAQSALITVAPSISGANVGGTVDLGGPLNVRFDIDATVILDIDESPVEVSGSGDWSILFDGAEVDSGSISGSETFRTSDRRTIASSGTRGLSTNNIGQYGFSFSGTANGEPFDLDANTEVGPTQPPPEPRGEIFFDDFEQEPDETMLNYDNFQRWDVTDGSVDLLFDFPGIRCADGSSTCVDLDGSTFEAGTMVSEDITLSPDFSYFFSFDLSGNQRTGCDPNSQPGSPECPVDRSTVVLQDSRGFPILTFTSALFGANEFSTLSRTFTVSSETAANIIVSHEGDDNTGMILDNVRLFEFAAVPEPGTLVLLGLGAFGLLAFARPSGRNVSS